MYKEGILAFSDNVFAKIPFGEIDITIRSNNKDDLQKLRDIIINFYEGLATMCQNMGDECSTYGFYAEDRETPLAQNEREYCEHDLKITKRLSTCKHANIAYINPLCELHGGVCEFAKESFKFSECAMYEPYPF